MSWSKQCRPHAYLWARVHGGARKVCASLQFGRETGCNWAELARQRHWMSSWWGRVGERACTCGPADYAVVLLNVNHWNFCMETVVFDFKFIEPWQIVYFRPSIVKDKTVLELGCGTGLLAIVTAMLGARCVIATDANSHVVSLAQKNVENNSHLFSASKNKIKVLKHGWGDSWPSSISPRRFDVILGADCCYDQKLLSTVAVECHRFGDADRCLVMLSSPYRDEICLNPLYVALEDSANDSILAKPKPNFAGWREQSNTGSSLMHKPRQNPPSSDQQVVDDRSKIFKDASDEKIGFSPFRLHRQPVRAISGVPDSVFARWCPRGMVLVHAVRVGPRHHKKVTSGANVTISSIPSAVSVPSLGKSSAHPFNGGPIHRELF